MRIENKDTKKEFEEVHIVIESEDELRLLWHRFNLITSYVEEKYDTWGNYKEPSNLSSKMYSKFDVEMKRQNITKEENLKQ